MSLLTTLGDPQNYQNCLHNITVRKDCGCIIGNILETTWPRRGNRIHQSLHWRAIPACLDGYWSWRVSWLSGPWPAWGAWPRTGTVLVRPSEYMAANAVAKVVHRFDYGGWRRLGYCYQAAVASSRTPHPRSDGSHGLVVTLRKLVGPPLAWPLRRLYPLATSIICRWDASRITNVPWEWWEIHRVSSSAEDGSHVCRPDMHIRICAHCFGCVETLSTFQLRYG